MICFKALEDTQTLNVEDMKVFWIPGGHFLHILSFVLPDPDPTYYCVQETQCQEASPLSFLTGLYSNINLWTHSLPGRHKWHPIRRAHLLNPFCARRVWNHIVVIIKFSDQLRSHFNRCLLYQTVKLFATRISCFGHYISTSWKCLFSILSKWKD